MRKCCLILLASVLYACFGMDAQVLDSAYKPLIKAAKESSTTALIVLQDGERVAGYHQETSDSIIETMSVTKSVLSLAIASLQTEGHIDSLSTPVSQYYPEWKQGLKREITIKHLMNHTSGLQNVRSARKEIHPSPDYIQLGLCASVVDTPGTEFEYNNKAVNILTGIIKRITGKSVLTYLRNQVFNPMGIDTVNWRTDDSGNCIGMAGFQTNVENLAALGQLVLEGGNWNGRQLISEQYMEQLLARSQQHTNRAGLLWWRMPSYERYTIDQEHLEFLESKQIEQDIIAMLKKNKGTYNSMTELIRTLGMNKFNEMRREMNRSNVPPAKIETGPIVGYQAKGYLGQHLIILPEYNLVAVRLIRNSPSYDPSTDRFSNFGQMVLNIARNQSDLN